MKQCNKCNEWKDESEFSKDKNRKDGLYWWCRECVNEYNRIRREKNREKNKNKTIDPDKLKQCNKCEELKPQSEFHKIDNNKDGIDCWCKSCRNGYRNDNKERLWSSQTLHQHKNKGYEINVLLDFVHELALNTRNCPICGCELDWTYDNGYHSCTPTLDRVDNENELREDNIQIVCRECNTAKGAKPMKEFVEYSKMVVEKFG